MLTWTPHGRIFPPPETQLPEWIGGYGALPFAVPTSETQARVFFSGRDRDNRAQIGACTLDLATLTIDPDSISREPLVAPGPLGSFDDSGCSVSCIVRQGTRWLLYYTGWMLGRSVPFYLAAGLAVSEDDGVSFRKFSRAPLLDRTDEDPFLNASPSVLIDDRLWRMWYVSATEWQQREGGARHSYLIKYAESDDGIHWRPTGRIAVPFASPDEYAMGRPHVVKDGSLYRMWFCVRGDRYRLAYAESEDGLSWTRRDQQWPAPSDWDRGMQAYPMTLRDRDRWILLYNGNDYGATGFGCATAF